MTFQRVGVLAALVLIVSSTTLPAQDAPVTAVDVQVQFIELKEPLDREGPPLAEQVLQRQKAGAVLQTSTVELSMAPESEARAQFGEDIGVPSGVTVVGAGRPITNYIRDQSGTIISAQPRLTDSGAVLLSLDVERSRYVNLPAAESGPTDFVPPTKEIVTGRTTLLLRDGESDLINTLASTGEGNAARQQVVLVTMRLRRSQQVAAAPAQENVPQAELRVYNLEMVSATYAQEVLGALLPQIIIRADARTNRIMARGTAKDLDQLGHVLELLDVASPRKVSDDAFEGQRT